VSPASALPPGIPFRHRADLRGANSLSSILRCHGDADIETVIWQLDWLKPLGDVTASRLVPTAFGWNDVVRAFGESAPSKVTVGLGSINPMEIGKPVTRSESVTDARIESAEGADHISLGQRPRIRSD
jgi:hypothetical protein